MKTSTFKIHLQPFLEAGWGSKVRYYYLWLTSSISPPAPVVMVLSIQPFGATSFARARLKTRYRRMSNFNTVSKIITIVINDNNDDTDDGNDNDDNNDDDNDNNNSK